MKTSFLFTALTAFIFFFAPNLRAQTIRYVTENGSNDKTGISWEHASDDLQAMINLSVSGDEIWVANGTYKPTQKLAETDLTGNPTTERDKSFLLKSGVRIYGGFAGNETLLSDRDAIHTQTILSGDIGVADDDSDNAYHVVVAVNVTMATILDGFIITKGNGAAATGILTVSGALVGRGSGGGLTIASKQTFHDPHNATPSIFNCTFRDNKATQGGGALITYAPPAGEMIPGGRRVRLFNCRFYNNSAAGSGGALYISLSPLVPAWTIGQSAFVEIVNSAFWNNTALDKGGAIFNIFSIVATNSTNTAMLSGALTLTNCTIAQNTAAVGGGAMRSYFTGPEKAVPTPTIRNSIIYGNNTGLVTDGTASPTIAHSLVQGVEDSNPDNLPGTVDPRFVNSGGGDFRLLPCSPAIDAGHDAFLPTLVTKDLNGESRALFGAVDMGAFETDNIATTLASLNTSVTQNQPSYRAWKYYTADCALLARITPAETNPVAGSTRVRVWIEEPDQSARFVKRHYEIMPENNGETVSGIVTLYFTQDEFDDFNTANASKPLPAGPDDEDGIQNLKIEKRSGISEDDSGLPGSYNESIATIDPNDEDIVWNDEMQRWEVSFFTTGFSGFFVKTQDTSLPVTLAEFSGKPEGSLNNLSWKTTLEVNASHFELESSLNGRVFRQVASIQAKNHSEGVEYYFNHTASTRQLYYRLKMVDFDGSFRYSSIISVHNTDVQKISIYPNPVSDKLYIKADGLTENSVILYDLSGRQLSKVFLKDGETELSVRELNAGSYLLRFADGSSKIIVKGSF